jgi:hypothetical protein
MLENGEFHEPDVSQTREESLLPVSWEAGWQPQSHAFCGGKEESVVSTENQTPVLYPVPIHFTGWCTVHNVTNNLFVNIK